MSTPELTQDALDGLAADFDGALVGPDHDAYEEARKVWSGIPDCRPALIASCASTQDVRAAVNFARDHGLLVSIRGGSHSDNLFRLNQNIRRSGGGAGALT